MVPHRRPEQLLRHGMSIRSYAGAGEPIVWIHGLGESGRCFDAIVRHRHLAGRAHLLIDLPGYGRAPWTAPVELDATVDTLVTWLDEVGPAVLVGHSLGGVIATLVAERAPARVRAIVDVDGNVSLGDCEFSSQVAMFAEDDFVDHGHDALWTKLCQAADDRALRGYAASMGFTDPRQMWRHAVDLVELSRREELAARRGALTVPLQFIAGAPDGICDRSRALLAAAGVAVVDVAPAGHWPFIDQPDHFAAIVGASLDRL